jgi:hypothetical protein
MKRHAFWWMPLGIALKAQGAAPEAAPAVPEVYLIGSIHDMHFEERYHYSLVDLQRQVLAQHPDVICGEITPEAYNAPMEGNFPPEAAMLAEMASGWGARFVPSDWRVSFAWQARGEQQEASDKAKATEVQAAQDEVKAYFDRFTGVCPLRLHQWHGSVSTDGRSDVRTGNWREHSIRHRCRSLA